MLRKILIALASLVALGILSACGGNTGQVKKPELGTIPAYNFKTVYAAPGLSYILLDEIQRELELPVNVTDTGAFDRHPALRVKSTFSDNGTIGDEVTYVKVTIHRDGTIVDQTIDGHTPLFIANGDAMFIGVGSGPNGSGFKFTGYLMAGAITTTPPDSFDRILTYADFSAGDSGKLVVYMAYYP
ncbi:hypothetical protein HGA91_01735 [candidate division WWE3 bacterium]|nr:hypothetical protein [candidate division WWE3 bacterium]